MLNNLFHNGKEVANLYQVPRAQVQVQVQVQVPITPDQVQPKYWSMESRC